MTMYKVVTSILTCAGDTQDDLVWLFNTRKEAQEFVDKFYEAFPKNERCMDYPFINSLPGHEIQVVNDNRSDPYKWLDKQIKMKKEHIRKYGR